MSISDVGSVAMSPVYSGGERVVNNEGGAKAAVAAAAVSASAPRGNGGGKAKAAMDDADFEKIMEEPIRQANKALAGFDRQIEREFHEVTKALMYTIRDTKTNEVIAEYPPRKIQDMIAKMWELAGLFIDQKA